MSVNVILLSAVPTVILRVKSDQKSNFPGVMTCNDFFYAEGRYSRNQWSHSTFSKVTEIYLKKYWKIQVFF